MAFKIQATDTGYELAARAKTAARGKGSIGRNRERCSLVLIQELPAPVMDIGFDVPEGVTRGKDGQRATFPMSVVWMNRRIRSTATGKNNREKNQLSHGCILT